MRWLAIFCIAASGAIFALQYGPVWTVFLLMALAAAALICAGVQKQTRRLAALVLAFGIAFGSCYSTLYTALFVQPSERFVDTEQVVTLTLSAYPVQHTYGAKVKAEMDVGALCPVQVQFYGSEELLDCGPGDRITTEASFRSASLIHGKKITSFTAKGMHLLLYGKGEMVIQPAQGFSLRYAPQRLGALLRSRIAMLYQGDAAILMTALMTGERSAFDDALYSALSETGLTHVTAVSGMHCAFLFTLVGLLVRNKRRATLVAIPVLVVFMLMVGGTPSVTRACFMLTMLSLAPLFNRENDKITTMSLALLLILLRNPCAAASISLQLSFAAVVSLTAFSGPMYRALAKRLIYPMAYGTLRSVCRFILATLVTTCAASFLTIPLAAYYFGCVSLISPLSNLLCLPAISFAFYAGVVSLLLGVFLMPLAAIVAIFATAALDYFMAMVHLLSQIPYNAIYTSNPYLVYWLAYFYIMIAVMWFAKDKRRRTVVMTATLTLSTLALVITLPVISNGRSKLNAAVLNVGQGESVMLCSGDQAALVDCGSTNSWINAGTVAANELNTLGYTDLDYLLLTHYHSDHANGLATLFSRMKIGCIVIPALDDEESVALQQEVLMLAKKYQTEVLLISEDETLTLGNAKLQIFSPLGAGNTNEEGLSVLCSCEEFDMLITGDMDSETEQQLLMHAALPDAEVLVVGHHGSKYSTSAELLRAIMPEEAIIPVGDNSYGHPTIESMGRIEEYGARLYRTDCNGTVYITVY